MFRSYFHDITYGVFIYTYGSREVLLVWQMFRGVFVCLISFMSSDCFVIGRTSYETCNLLYLVFLLTDVGVVEASSEGYVGGTARTILNIW